MLCPTPFFVNCKTNMKIKAKNPKIASMKLIVPVDGEISIDGNGVADVSAKCAVALVTGTNDWAYASKAKNAPEVEDEDDEEEDDTDEASDRDKFEAHLKTLKLEEMKAMAEEGEMPKEEGEKLNSKKLMSAYLLKKYDEAEANGELDEDDEEEDDTDEDGK